MIEISNLKKALTQLKNHYELSQSENNPEKKFAFETATVKSFEYVYEISVKLLKRFLRENLSSEEELKLVSFKELVRIGAESNFIDDPKQWFEYREKRNITSHTYDEEKSHEILKTIPEFIKHVENLLTKFQEINAN